jgi:hypothetical protein
MELSMKKLLFLISLIFIFAGVLQADISEYYEFSQTTETYADITGTAVTAAQGDDVYSAPIDIGFNFVYGTNTYTQVVICSNGFVRLGSTTSQTLSNDLESTTYCPVIAALWDDLHTGRVQGDTYPQTSSVQYLLQGTAPNRTFTVQYQYAYWYYNASPASWVNFQVVIKENGGISIKYGPNAGTNPGTSASASIGINMLPGGATNFWSVTPGSPATASNTVENTTINAYIPSGTVYNFNPPVGVPNDLSAMAISGSTTPSVGTSTPYTITVRNRGTNPQTTYSVKLMSGTTELATVAGPAIAPAENAQVVVNWTPTTEGALTLTGKVVLAGDQNTLNDETAPLNINVQAAGTIMVTVGDGSQTARVPIDFYYKNSLFETIYQASEMTAGGLMTSITFYNQFTSTELAAGRPIKIWLGTTDLTDLSGGWIPSTSLTLVFDGNVSFPSGQNDIMVTLQTPFPFGGGNLVMMVQRPMDTIFYDSTDYFKCQTVGTNRSLKLQSDSVVYDPTAPATATPSGQFPKTTFRFVSQGTTPQFSVSPQSYNFGQKLMNTVSNQTFNVMNVGGGTTPLVISNITISGSPFFTLQNLPTLPVSLASVQSTSFAVRYNPTAAGEHTATVTITDNLTRTQHQVPISATCVDPTIYTSPYVQNFDGSASLPIDWQSLAVSPGVVAIYTSSPHSTPNCMRIYNSTSTDGPYLIAPPISNTIPLTTMRVKFWAKGSTTYHLHVGVMSDPLSSASFTQIQDITLTSSWAEYIVSFQSYMGTGNFIAFKHGNASTSQTIYVDDVTIEVTPNNDLAALALTGNITPTVGVPTTFTLSITNFGMATETNYQVKLYNNDNVELASAAGPSVEPGATVSAPISWTPTTAGPDSIYGKVVMATDQNSLNNNTPQVSINVMPAGVIMATIGDGTSTQRQPLGIYYGYERDATIYTSEQIGTVGLVTGIQWYCATTATAAVPFKVYMKTTTETAHTAVTWDTMVSDATQVLQTTFTFSQTGWNYFTFDTPYVYTGTNLMVLTETYYGGSGTTSPYFRYTTGATGCHQYWYADTNPPTGNGTLNTYRPNVGISLTSVSNDPQFAINPMVGNYGTVLINTTTNKNFNMTNIGGGTLTISSITISGSPFFTLQNLPTLPVTLGQFQSAGFVARYMPTTAGDHTAIITITDDLTRLQHTVNLSATAVDVTIYTLPYFQNFDAVTTPNLPVDWNSIFTSPGYVRSYTTSPHSAPNCVYIYNSTSTAGPYLIAPPIANTIPMNTVRVRFWAKGSTSYVLSVGITGDPTDALTYEQTTSFNLTSSWAEYVVGFQTYAGTGRYITFKHGNASTSQSIYVDDVMIEVIADNDLAAVSITGNESPSVGNSYTYTVAVTNWGSLPQSNYLVKLFNSDNQELASVAGPAIDAGLTLNADVTWTPTTQGAMSIYGKVVLTGDQNNLNDSSPSMPIYVHPAGTQMVTIGTGTSTQAYPLYTYYGYSRDASLYTEDQFGGVVGRVTGVQWYATTQYGISIPYRIYLKNTTETALTAQPWATTISDATLMAEGIRTVDQTGWVYFAFPDTSNFVYLGGNLVVMVENNYGGTGTTSYSQWRYTTGPTASHHYNYADTNPPTTNGYTNTSRPNIGISFSSMGTTPQFAVSPASYNYGQTFMNLVYNKTFNITNIGGGTNPLVINSITISGSPFFTLQNLPTLPVSLGGFQSTSFVARYNPTAIGEHSATITITDNLARTYTISVGRESRNDATRTQHLVQLTASCIDPTIYTSPYVQNFDGVSTPNLPIDWSKWIVSPGNVTTSTTSPHSTPNCVYIYNSTSVNGPYLISPPIASTLPLNTMRVKFWAKGSTSYHLSVGAMVDPNDAATYTQMQDITLTSSWAEYTVGFQTYTGNGQFMAFKHGNASTSQSIYVDDVMIEVIPQNDLGAVSITGNSTPSVGMATNYTINLINHGTNSQTDYQVKLYKEGDIELASVAGPTIAPGMTGQAVVTWVPAAQGATFIYGKVVLTGDQNNLNDQTPNLNVAVQPAGTMVVTIGDGSSTARMPFDFFYKNSLFETIYQQSELNFIGMITGISLYSNFTSTELAAGKPVKIWMGTTTQTDLSAGWIPSTQLTAVLDTLVSFPQGENVINLTLPQPFLYLQDNLVVMFQRPMDTTYFDSTDLFRCQTVGTNRSRNSYDDTTVFDPANPSTTDVTVTGTFPKTSFMVIPGGVGHLTGTVYGAGNLPLANATVQIVGGGSAVTNAQGQYTIMNIIDGDYQVTASRYGYISQTVNVTIPEDSTVTQNFTLQQMPTVTVTGTIVGSDNPTVGLPGATIAVTGYESYNATANAQGQFTITGVYANQSYNYTASAVGYQNYLGSFNVGGTNLNLPDIVLSEIAYTPRAVVATEALDHSTVTLTWQAPDPNAVDITQSFESETFPPTDWTRIVTNNGPANTSGVYPTWCRFGTVTSGTTTVIPSDGSWQCGFWWDYNHQDEWLITPQFNCPQGSTLTFGSYYYRGSTNGDHYYVKVTNNNGDSWNVLWDAATLTGGWANYDTPIVIDLAAYAGQQIKLAWHADDPNTTNDGMWYNWFIDNVIIGNSTRTIRFTEDEMTVRSGSRPELPLSVVTDLPMSRSGETRTAGFVADRHISTGNTKHTRALLGYKVWRLAQGQEQNESTWTLLTPDIITALTLTDTNWGIVDAGTYKWAVKGVYTSNVLSLAVFSNAIVREPVATGTLVGTVRNQQNQAIVGATITAGAYTATTNASGVYSMNLPAGTYAVTCSATGYQSLTYENVIITAGQTTQRNFIMTVGVEDQIEVTATVLKGNYPNPFNPVTTIAYDVKVKAPVRIEIYNTKGQLIRTLVDAVIDKGHHHVVWNGKDNSGNSVASGVYTYRMQAGEYKATRNMMLMK